MIRAVKHAWKEFNKIWVNDISNTLPMSQFPPLRATEVNENTPLIQWHLAKGRMYLAHLSSHNAGVSYFPITHCSQARQRLAL